MVNTKAFLISALASIIVAVIISNQMEFIGLFALDIVNIVISIKYKLDDGSFAYSNHSLILANALVCTILSISIAILMGLTESALEDRSITKYSPALDRIFERTINFSSRIDLHSKDMSYVRGNILYVLEIIMESFHASSDRSYFLLKGRYFSVSLMKVDGDAVYLFDNLFKTSSGLGEEFSNDVRFNRGTGFCGWVLTENRPQSGRARKIVRRDRRFSALNQTISGSSFYSSPIYANKSTTPTHVLNITSDSRRDFLWHYKHAIYVYRGMQPANSLLQHLLSQYNPQT